MATRRGPDNSVRVTIEANDGAGIAIINSFAVQCTVSGTPTQADLDAWLTSFCAAWKTRFQGALAPSYTSVGGRAVFFLPGGTVLESAVANAWNGTGGTNTSNHGTCAVLSWLTSVYWRGGKPRTYLGPIPTTFSSDGKTITGANVTGLETDGAGFRTDVNALTHGAITASTLGFVSFRSGGADRVPPIFFAFNGVKVHPRIGEQRRRLGNWTP